MQDIFYSLTVMYLVFTGFAFILPLIVKSKEDYDRIQRYFFGGKARTPAGIIALVLATGLFFFPKTRVVLLGDFLPLLMLLGDSAILLMANIRSSRTLEDSVKQRAEVILGDLQIPLGILSMLVGFVHVFFSWVPLL